MPVADDVPAGSPAIPIQENPVKLLPPSDSEDEASETGMTLVMHTGGYHLYREGSTFIVVTTTSEQTTKSAVLPTTTDDWSLGMCEAGFGFSLRVRRTAKQRGSPVCS